MSRYEFVEVESVEELDEVEDTFDITVEGTHNFFANGMLVHNCLGGIYAGNYWENREEGEEAVLQAMRETSRTMLSIFGDRWYGEVQWNNIPEQHELNQYVIKVCDEFGIELVSTADSHYPRPDSWKDRELYKRMAWLGKKAPNWMSNELPSSVEEIGYELYPKNGDQMWEAYKKYSQQQGQEYDDQLILDSIKRTHHIAMNRIESYLPDSTVRLPKFVLPEGFSTADSALKELCISALHDAGLYDNKEYFNRLVKELEVISERGFSEYFLTMKAIADEAVELSLVGPARGSAAGSLIAYLLGITQVDPMKYGLLFERFLTRAKNINGSVGRGGKQVKGKFVKLKSSDGKVLTLTEGISAWVMRGGEKKLVKALDIKQGDILVD